MISKFFKVFSITNMLLFSALIAQAQPNISTVFGPPGTAGWGAMCGAGASVPSGASGLSACNPATSNCLLRVTIPTADFPNAVCNDGTPGVFYIRPGVGADANKWIVHTQGGGRCADNQSCQERWCGQQGALPYQANKMSTDWNADGFIDLPMYANAGGQFSISPNNYFSDWTHVWAYYCSSDSWMGRANNVSYLGANNFSIHQQGHNILEAMRSMLRKTNPNPAWTTDCGTAVADLDTATDVMFTGTSAGAKGALQNVDWFMAPLPAPNKSLVLDANLDMTDLVLWNNDIWIDEDGDSIGDQLYYSKRITMSQDSWSTGWNFDVDAFVDESCRAVYEPMGRLDRCSYFGPLLTLKYGGVPLLETETFIRLDLEDGVVDKKWDGGWPTGEQLMVGQFGRFTTEDDFTVLARESLEQLFTDPTNSVTGVFGPRCGQHVGLEANIPFGLHTTPDTMPAWVAVSAAQNAHDAIWDWYTNPLGVHRTLDTGDVGDPLLQNHPIFDPVTQFSAGPSCQY